MTGLRLCGVVTTTGAVLFLKGATCDNLSTMKIPCPWQREVGFIIQSPPFLLKSSANMMYSLGRKKVRGRKSQSYSTNCFYFCNSLLCLRMFLISISLRQSWVDVGVPDSIVWNGWFFGWLWVFIRRRHWLAIFRTIGDANRVRRFDAIYDFAGLWGRSCWRRFWKWRRRCFRGELLVVGVVFSGDHASHLLGHWLYIIA